MTVGASLPWLLVLGPLLAAMAARASRAAAVRQGIAAAAAAAHLALSVLLAATLLGRGPVGGGLLGVDALSALLLPFVSFLHLVATLHGLTSGDRDDRPVAEPLQLGVLAAMTLVLTADDLALLWAATAVTALVAAMLAHATDPDGAREWPRPFLVLHAVATALTLLGTVLLHAAATLPEAGDLAFRWSVLKDGPRLDPRLLRASLLLGVVGWGAQAGLLPPHAWLSQALRHRRGPVAALLAGAWSTCSLYALLRHHALALRLLDADLPGRWLAVAGAAAALLTLPALWLGGAAARLAPLVALHAGLALMAIGLGGSAATAGLAHLVTRAVATVLLVLAAASAGLGPVGATLAWLRFPERPGPFVTLTVAVAVLAAAGLPPSAPFLSGLAIVATTTRAHLGAGLLALTGLGLAGLLLLLGRGTVRGQGPAPPPPRAAARLALSLLLLAIVGLGLAPPPPLLRLVQQAAAVVSAPVLPAADRTPALVPHRIEPPNPGGPAEP